GTAHAAPLDASASAPASAFASVPVSSSTLGTNSVLMNLTSTPMVPNGSALSAGSNSSISSGWSAFQAGVLGFLDTDADPSPLSGSLDQSPSLLQVVDQLSADLDNGGSLDPVA